MTESINNSITEYISIEEEIKGINKTLKELRETKKALNDVILDYLTSNDLMGGATIENISLKLVKSKPAKKVSKHDIIDAISSNMDDTKAVNVIDKLYSNEDQEEVVKLVIQKSK